MGRHSAPTRRELRRARPRPVRRLPGSTVGRVAAAGAGAVVLSATVGFMSVGKHVQVIVDGEPRMITTYASDVRGVLLDAGVSPTGHDVVTPSPSSPVIDGTTIDVTQVRKVTVTLDGASTTRYVSAATTAEAVTELGLSDRAVVSSRSSRLPLRGGKIELATYRPVTVVADGVRQVVHTAAQTVADALADAGVSVQAGDQVAPAPTSPVSAGMTIEVTRTGQQTVTEQHPVAHGTVEKTDEDQYVGIDRVESAGSDGVETVTFAVTTTAGVETGRTEVSREITTPAVNAVVVKGAKQFPASVDALNWKALGFCESTNNPKAVNKTNGKYFGEYQFSVETWAGVGGTGNPMDAPAEEQLARAKILFMKYGAGQWECGSHLYD